MSWRAFSAARAVFWLVSIPPAYMLGWLRSVTYVAVLSVVALVESAVAAWRADVPNNGGFSAYRESGHREYEP